MRSILDNNKLPLTDFQYNLLCSNFAFDENEFNYVDFIEVLKQYEQENWNFSIWFHQCFIFISLI